MRLRLTATAILAATVIALACGGSDSPTAPSERTGTFNLMLKDSPFTDARAVLVTFSEVTAHRSTEADFTKLPFAGGATSRTCDLKRLQTAQDVLGTGPLTAGQYTQVRLVVSGVTLHFDNESTGPACAATISLPGGRSVEVPSGEVKLNRQFTVPEGGATNMLLDFDGNGSIHETGNGRYVMRPVIHIVSVS